ncbi:MAG: methyltransferase domain-containing protein [Candidatus Acididesulfobacter guangdongensis]|uniref:Methyltransferase domain-containing protein n=1 Tax=Acididesulfobacter guangdongensis TaxID=2597225 RepID=A0A519BEE7_ACIG2|nr:MAG: methyltransferase domain-containing protein [Candidatus Acididesulfobacter guangdongensis]
MINKNKINKIDKNKVKKNFSNSHQYDNAISYHSITLEMIADDILSFFISRHSAVFINNDGWLNRLNILDAGCGTCNGLLHIKNKINNNNIKNFDFIYLGVDIALGALKRGQSKVKADETGGAYLCCADCEEMPVKNKIMNVVFSNMVLHWLNKPLHFIKSVKNSLNLDSENLFICSFLSEGTLKELNLCYDKYKYSGGNTAKNVALHKFPDACYIKELLISEGFVVEEFKIVEHKEYAKTAFELFKRINLIGAKNSTNNFIIKDDLNKTKPEIKNTELCKNNASVNNQPASIGDHADNIRSEPIFSRYSILKKVLKDYENTYTADGDNVYASYYLTYIRAKLAD